VRRKSGGKKFPPLAVSEPKSGHGEAFVLTSPALAAEAREFDGENRRGERHPLISLAFRRSSSTGPPTAPTLRSRTATALVPCSCPGPAGEPAVAPPATASSSSAIRMAEKPVTGGMLLCEPRQSPCAHVHCCLKLV
jgi:hypothetical protein